MSSPYRVFSHEERPDLVEARDGVIGRAWPECMLHDAVCERLWGELGRRFSGFQFVLVDEEDGLAAAGNSIPFAWDGRPGSLPDGVDEVLALGIRQHEEGVEPNTLCALQAVVVPEW